MRPWEDLADHLSEFDLQVYPTMTEQLDTPCVVIMPDDPWIEPTAFSIDRERYLAIAVATGSDGASAQAELHRLSHIIRHNLPEGWDFESTGNPAQTDHQGITYMAANTRLTFSACTNGDEPS